MQAGGENWHARVKNRHVRTCLKGSDASTSYPASLRSQRLYVTPGDALMLQRGDSRGCPVERRALLDRITDPEVDEERHDIRRAESAALLDCCDEPPGCLQLRIDA